ncbi:MAG: GDSL family lipase [Sphingomonadaceae bacterium]|nr:GDSL family lipase [Sphingomonadaceae bacterium]
MSRTLKILLVVAALALGASVYLQRARQAPPPLPLLGMNENPCSAFDRTSGQARWRYDWAEICRFQDANSRLDKQGHRPQLVMIGDSLTEYWNISDPEIVQRGIAGQSSDHVFLRFRQDAVNLQPEMVHILVGTNDIAGNTGPATPDRVIGNIRSMVEIARANGITPIIGTLPPAREFAWAKHNDPNPWVDILNQKIRALAESKGIALAEYHDALAGKPDVFDQALFDDGAHPNEAGYARMKPVLDAARSASTLRKDN